MNTISDADRAEHKPHPSYVPAILKDDLLQVPPDLLCTMKNPLTSIYLSVGILSPVLKDADQQVCIDIILRNATRLNDMINALLWQKDLAYLSKRSPGYYSPGTCPDAPLFLQE